MGLERSEILLDNRTTNVQVALMFAFFIPLICAYLYMSSLMFDTTRTIMEAVMILVTLHVVTLLLMNTPVVIRKDRISVPFPPFAYMKRTLTFRAREIDSIVYDGVVFDVRRKDGFHRTFRKNKLPFNRRLLEGVKEFCWMNDIEFIEKKRNWLTGK
jgi:hypothetical protein